MPAAKGNETVWQEGDPEDACTACWHSLCSCDCVVCRAQAERGDLADCPCMACGRMRRAIREDIRSKR